MPEGDAPPSWFTDALAVESKVDSVQVDGISVAYRTWGGGDRHPLLFVHGSSAHSRWWDHIAPFLAHDRAVCAVDLSGHGDSDWREVYSWTAWTQEVQAVGREITRELTGGAAKPLVIGHSLGGRVAVQSASGEADVFAGLIVLDSMFPLHSKPEAPTPAEPRVRPERRAYATKAEAMGRYRLQYVPETAVLPYVLHHLAETSLVEVDGRYAWKRDVWTEDRVGEPPGADDLARVRCPVAWIHAEHSGRITADLLSGFERILGRPVPAIQIPDAHHHLMVDHPLSLITALRAVLAMWSV